MPTDALLVLQASTTKATTFNGAALILPGGTPRRGLKARILYSASTSTTTNAATFSLDVCYDGVPTTWRSDFVADPPLALTTTAQAGEIYIPFDISPTVIAGVITAPQIRVTVTISGAGTASVVYQADLVLTRP
jgi:hypothetical protein